MGSSDTAPRPHIPDALKDSTRDRATRAARRLNFGGGLLPRLLVAGSHELQHIVLALGPSSPAELYDPATNARARAAVAAVVGTAPTWATLERGREGDLHAHIITASNAPLLLPAGSHRKAVDTPLGLMRYLSKPADARACQHRDPQTGIRSKPDPAQLQAAVQDYQQARTRGRLPRLSWTLNLPRLKPDADPSQPTG
ncbi:hypothetical protein [Deinococcus aquatilis]|uniref:hypothetical protein n=1 Tax=Deinococcus aquatilis TaxID=519440 RepID=UPI00037A2EA5|nr:hypothetical protein [Deinococcus aquatilis]